MTAFIEHKVGCRVFHITPPRLIARDCDVCVAAYIEHKVGCHVADLIRKLWVLQQDVLHLQKQCNCVFIREE